MTSINVQFIEVYHADHKLWKVLYSLYSTWLFKHDTTKHQNDAKNSFCSKKILSFKKRLILVQLKSRNLSLKPHFIWSGEGLL
ncbi:hypothetical protein EBI00_07575 [Marinomonas hwangdonensis]|uniref:Uncharacterized protein n=1 Tax=Marinomonas hwangdonensis TaxID=1053647 RepID=A0A3M8Q6M8_9GAMM|nr:hypothetical protein EBI00_07575 [Marinomonas hwangdonensis]